MNQRAHLCGNDLKGMFTAGMGWLEKIVPDINALNVYPVPDGDCGTNMLFTLRSSIAEAGKLDEDMAIGSVAEAFAKGALMGARGNSGVILSQILRGLFEGMKEKETVDCKELAQAFRKAAETAYHALSNPVEGTILTVIKDAADAAEQEADEANASPVTILSAMLDAAGISVRKTPDLLQVLKDAGVVDAGGHGFYTIIEGALLYLKHDMDNRKPELLHNGAIIPVQTPQDAAEEEPFGFCTQFMLHGSNMDIDALRNRLEDMGNSLIVVGDSSTIRVHVHTQQPDKVLEIATEYAEPVDIDINDMDEQHIEFLVLHKEKMTQQGTAIIAVVNGDGMMNAFSDLGVSAIIPGGQTMNPSTMDMLQTIEEVPPDHIILLPNNKNVIPTANLVQPLTKKTVTVIPTETIPQGISALISYVPEEEYETNVEEMMGGYVTVSTIEITRATRSTTANGIKINHGEVIGLIDGELATSGTDFETIILSLLEKIDMSEKGVLTLFYGKDADETKAETIAEKIGAFYPGLEIGIVDGGQPHYDYIISVD